MTAEQQPQQSAQTSESSTEQQSTTAQSAQEQSSGLSVRDEFKGLVENKGWKDVNEVISSYQNLEKFVGKQSNAVAVPDPEDNDGWQKVYNKLGRPESADKYDFGVDISKLDEKNKEAISKFSQVLFDTGLNNKQAKQLQQSLDNISIEHQKQVQTQLETAAAQREKALKDEWGQAYDQNQRLANLAAEKFGLKDIADPLAAGEVYDKMMKMFAEVGASLSEDGYVSGGSSTGTGRLTVSQAQIQLQELKADPDYLDTRKNPERHKLLHMKAKELYAAIHPES